MFVSSNVYVHDSQNCKKKNPTPTIPKQQNPPTPQLPINSEAFLSLLKENTAKEKISIKKTLQEIQRESNLFHLTSGKNHSYRRYFAVKKTMEISRSAGDTTLGSLDLLIKVSKLKHLVLEITVCIFVWNYCRWGSVSVLLAEEHKQNEQKIVVTLKC